MSDLKYLGVILLASAFCFMLPPHPKTVDFQLQVMCSNHPDKPCKDIIEYCKQALSTGNECYIID